MQERLQKIAWLAGITDGDGNLGIYKQPSKTSGLMYVPRFSIVTTCKLTMEYLHTLCEDLGIGHYWSFVPSKHSSWNSKWNLDIRGYKRVKRVLELIVPFLVTKKLEAQLMLKYINSRLELGRVSYTQEELKLIQVLKDIKANRNLSVESSEAIRSALVQS